MNIVDFLSQDKVKQFISENEHVDVSQLILNPPKDLRDNISLIADQLLARRKAKGKLDNWANNFDLLFPPPLSIEQSSSNSTADYKKSLAKGKHLIDLTGGMGIDTLALSEGFEKATYVEQQANLCDLFNYNTKVLDRSIEVVNATSEHFLRSFDGLATFFIDPARRDRSKNKVFKLKDCSPNLLELMDDLRKKADRVLVKLSPLLDLSSLIDEVPDISKIHVVSVKNDCKEVLLMIDFASDEKANISCVNLETDEPSFDFSFDEERTTKSQFESPKAFLYEPNASILKAGAFKSIGDRYRLSKLGVNTHLYTSDQRIDSFPGRVFRVIEEGDKQSIPRIAVNNSMNVLTRNYPLSPDQLKKKFKLKDGGDYFLIGFRDLNDKPRLLIADR